MTSSKILSFEYEKKIYAFLLHFTHLSVSLQRFKCSYHMKRLLILTTLFVLCLCMTAQTPSIIDRPKVGLVLGGGGTKGAAELGALKVIEELNIPIDYIAGTSIGAILGGLYATGYRAEQLDSLFRSGLWMTDNVLELLERLTETDEWIDFDELPIPFRCVAVDFDTQEEVVFRNGHLATAMRASMAIPGRTYRCFECPDFFQLTVDNGPKKGQKKWVLVVLGQRAVFRGRLRRHDLRSRRPHRPRALCPSARHQLPARRLAHDIHLAVSRSIENHYRYTLRNAPGEKARESITFFLAFPPEF